MFVFVLCNRRRPCIRHSPQFSSSHVCIVFGKRLLHSIPCSAFEFVRLGTLSDFELFSLWPVGSQFSDLAVFSLCPSGSKFSDFDFLALAPVGPNFETLNF